MMEERLTRDRLFVALTRPQMFAGVTWSFFVINFILSAEAFLITRSIWVVALALGVHGAGVAACLHDPRRVDLWLLRLARAPRVGDWAVWRCNSYGP